MASGADAVTCQSTEGITCRNRIVPLGDRRADGAPEPEKESGAPTTEPGRSREDATAMMKKHTTQTSQPALRKAALIADQLPGSAGGGVPPAGGAVALPSMLPLGGLLITAVSVVAYLVWRGRKHH